MAGAAPGMEGGAKMRAQKRCAATAESLNRGTRWEVIKVLKVELFIKVLRKQREQRIRPISFGGSLDNALRWHRQC